MAVNQENLQSPVIEGQYPENKSLIEIDELFKSFGDQEVLHGITTAFPRDQLSLVRGSSGSGKSTLLRCISGLARPDQGTVHCGDIDITKVDDELLTKLRGKSFGFIFQDARLSDGLTAEQNIRLQHELQDTKIDKDWFDHIITTLEIGDKLGRNPPSLSSGERQRVGIARALVHHPAILYADEPTGALNSELRHSIYSLMKSFVLEGITTVIVSHDSESQQYADHQIELKDGIIVTPQTTSLFNR